MEIIWHYTTITAADNINVEQIIKVSETERKFGLKPAVWFSKNPDWEPTATKLVGDNLGNIRLMTKQEQFDNFGLCRIGIKFTDELISWAKYKHAGRIAPLKHEQMELDGINRGGNPKDWYASFNNIPAEKWITFDQFDGKKWLSIIQE